MKTNTHYVREYHGKWILSGEHAVTRGHSAIVVPFHEKTYLFEYHKTNKPLQLNFYGTDCDLVQPHLDDMLKQTLKHAQTPADQIQGNIQINNQIPLGIGLGFSAVWSTSFAEWLIATNLSNEPIFELAQSIENYFHAGCSSGLDIHGIQSDLPVHFKPNHRNQAFTPTWQPHIYIQNLHQRALTQDAIKRVHAFQKSNPAQSQYLDDAMQKSVDLAIVALQLEDLTEAHELLKESMRISQDCYQQWGLSSRAIEKKLDRLIDLGAIATRISGKGSGGIAIGFWPEKLDESFIHKHQLYPGFSFLGDQHV